MIGRRELKTVKATVVSAAVSLVCVLKAGEALENDRVRVELKDNHAVVLHHSGLASREFKMEFVVLYHEGDPRLKLRPLHGIRYNIPSWTAVDPAKANLAHASKDGDVFEVGDGFDPSILKGGTEGKVNDIFQAAPSFWVTATGHSFRDGGVDLSFGDHPLFSLSARLELDAGTATPRLSFQFKPSANGSYSVGYVGAPASDPTDADEIWQPLIWQEKRFPRHSHLTLAFRCPVPSAFVTEGGITTGVVADREEYPFDPLPTWENSRFGVAVRDATGKARAQLFAPVLGGAGSDMQRGESFRFSLCLFARAGNTMDAQEVVARELYGFRDLRNNALGSLNRTIENMRDYAMSSYSLFSEANKGCNYSTDAPGAVKNVSSIDPLDLAIVTDDEAMFRQRAYPYIEYMLSRGKFLFTTDETQRTQFPSYRLDGPAAPVSELAALWSIFHEATPLFRTLAEREFGSARIRNLNVADKGDAWWNALSLYRSSGEKHHLEAAIAGADRYLEKRMAKAQDAFKDDEGAGGFFFWTGYAPRYIDLLMLYEASGEQRFLDAARVGARRYAQFVWLSPAVPDEEVTVNKGGKAPVYWYLRSKGHKQVHLPEESVPAWRLSSIGLTAESSATSSGHRAIFMANHAPWMMKIGYLCQDRFLMELARSAVIGRYRNFPGYHINTARTTAYEKQAFPLCGHKEQSVTSFHYNHIFPMLSMLVDYLVTDAFVRSGGEIAFPYNYSEGYAYMQNRAYGAMKGSFYGRNDALLWMPKGLLHVPDQINYIAARGEEGLYLALMNESLEDFHAEVAVNPQLLAAVAGAEFGAEVISGTAKSRAILSNGNLRVPVKARGLTAVLINNLKVSPRFQDQIADLEAGDAWERDLVPLQGVAGNGMILNLGSGCRFAYVFLEYSKHDYRKVELVYRTPTGERRVEDTDFPWELTVPLSSETASFDFYLKGHRPDGAIDVICPRESLERNIGAEASPKRQHFILGAGERQKSNVRAVSGKRDDAIRPKDCAN